MAYGKHAREMAFQEWYRQGCNADAARRILQKDAKFRNLQTSTITRWGEEEGWRERAKALDAKARLEADRRLAQERVAMLERHAVVARALQTVAKRRLAMLDKSFEELTPSEVRHYLREGIELERKSVGLPDYLLEVAAIGDDELLRLKRDLLDALAAQAVGGGGEGDEAEGAGEDEGRGDEL